jgi:hypothetical protein
MKYFRSVGLNSRSSVVLILPFQLSYRLKEALFIGNNIDNWLPFPSKHNELNWNTLAYSDHLIIEACISNKIGFLFEEVMLNLV